MAFTEHASKKYVDERDALLATKNALAAEAEERARLANIVAQNRRDTYSKDEVNRIVEALRGARFVKVERLPELADADMLAIYLVPRTSPETDNRYDEYIVVTDGEGARSWDKLGSTDIDLSGYATKAEVQVVRESVGALSESVDELQESITSESSRISTLEDKVGNPSFVPTEDSNDLISSGGVFAALTGKADKETDERFMRTKADIYLSARKGNDANDGLAPSRAVKTIGRAYAAAKAAVDAQTLDGTKQVVVAVDEGVYGSVELNCELTAGIAFRAVGARDSTFVVPSNDPGDEANQTPMSCDNGVYPHVFEMEGFTFTGFNGRHLTDINGDSHQRGIVYGMTLRRCLITGNRPICTKAFVCGTFIDCEITGNATRPTPEGAGGDAPFGGYGAVYDDLAYMTRMFNCHVWDNDFSTFQYFASKIEASGCLFENSFAVAKGVADSYGGHNNTMIAERYTNPYFAYSDTRSKFYKIGVKYFAVIASPAGSTTDPFYTETADYVCVQSAQLTEDKVAADASCPSVMSDGSPDFGWRDSGLGLKKTADALTNGKQDALIFDTTPTAGSTNPVTSAGIRAAIADAGFVTVVANACHSDRQSTTTAGVWDWNKTSYRAMFTNRFPDYTFEAADTDNMCMMGFGLPGSWNFNPNLDDTYFVLNSASQNYATKYGQMSIPVNVVNANGRIRMTISYCMSAYNSGDTRNVNFDVKMDGSVVAQVRDPHASKTSTSQVVVFADVDSAPSHTLTISADNTTATCGVVIAGIKIDFKAADYATAAPSTDISAAGKPADAKATGDALAALRTGKQDALSAQQLANIAAVPDKANKSALPYAIAAAETGTVAVPDPDIFPITWTANIFGDIQTYTIADASGCTVQYDSSYFNYRLHDTVRDIDIMLINADGTFNSDFDEYPYMVDNIKIGSDQHTPVSNMDTMLDFALVADLADRTVNKVALQAGTSAFSLTLPTQNDGRSRDFLLLIDNTATGAVDATATVVDATLVDAAGTAIASLAAPAGKATAYRLTEAANGTASPSANPVFIVAGANTDQQIARKLDAASAFPAFSAASTYTVGDVVTHEGGLYVCSTAVETAGPWDADDWTATSIAALLSRAVPMVVVDDEIEVAGLADTRRNGNDPDFATSWGNYVPLSWCYSYALNTSQGAYGIRLNSYTEPGNTANGVTLIAESSDGKPIYSAELVRTFAAPFDGEYDLEVTIRAPHNAINLPRYYDVLVDDETTPRLAYRPATSLSADEERVTRPGAIVLARGEHRLRIRALRHNNDNINMAVRGLKITTGN